MSDPAVTTVVQSILKFLTAQVENRHLSDESVESVEVAIQCLGSAYNVTNTDLINAAPDLMSLLVKPEPVEAPSMKNDAEKYKNLGNTLMKEEKFEEAIEAYTQAIIIDPSNAIYYCNRAAAHSRLNDNNAAIHDCKMAVQIDPSYSKAYSRLGFSYSSLGKHREAHESYFKAYEIEPDNESYKSNLTLAEQQIAQGDAPSAAGFDFNSLMQNRGLINIASQMMQNPNMRSAFQNPILRNAASQMLQNPNVQNVLSDLMNMDGDESNVESFVDVSRELAEQMRAGNPDLMETINREVANILETNVQKDNSNDEKENTKE